MLFWANDVGEYSKMFDDNCWSCGRLETCWDRTRIIIGLSGCIIWKFVVNCCEWIDDKEDAVGCISQESKPKNRNSLIQRIVHTKELDWALVWVSFFIFESDKIALNDHTLNDPLPINLMDIFGTLWLTDRKIWSSNREFETQERKENHQLRSGYFKWRKWRTLSLSPSLVSTTVN